MEEESPLDLKSPVSYRSWHRILSRAWKPHLSPSEYSLVDMIFDRTFGWGKEWENISYEQFERGVTSREGRKLYTGGTGLSRSTIKRCLQHLQSFGCIFVRDLSDNPHPGESLAYALNYEWTPPMLAVAKPRKPRSLGLRQPKIVRLGGVQNDSGGGSKRTPGGVQNDPQRVEELIEEGTIEENEVESPTNLSELIHSVRKDRKEAFVTLITSVLANREVLTKNQIEIIWTAAVDEYFPEVKAFKLKEKEALAILTYVKRYVQVKHTETFGVYLSWCVRHWRTILSEKFAWMTSKPDLPSVPFFVRFSDKFEEVFSRRQEIEAILALPARDRLIRELTAKGTPVEIATEQVDKQLATSRQLKDIETARESLNRERTALAHERTAPLPYRGGGQALQHVAEPVRTRRRVAIIDTPVTDMPEKFEEFAEQ